MNRFTLRLFILATALFMSTSAVAEGKWQKTLEGCNTWDKSSRDGATVSWSGECVNGKAEGVGVLTWRWTENGKAEWERAEGNLSEGAKSGNVTIETSTGARFEGEINGLGKAIYSNGDFNIGKWQDDRRNGYGYYQSFNGGVYKGKWQDGSLLQEQSSSVNDGTVSQPELESDLKQAEEFKAYVDAECLWHPSCPDVKKFAAEEVAKIKTALQNMAPKIEYPRDMRQVKIAGKGLGSKVFRCGDDRIYVSAGLLVKNSFNYIVIGAQTAPHEMTVRFIGSITVWWESTQAFGGGNSGTTRAGLSQTPHMPLTTERRPDKNLLVLPPYTPAESPHIPKSQVTDIVLDTNLSASDYIINSVNFDDVQILCGPPTKRQGPCPDLLEIEQRILESKHPLQECTMEAQAQGLSLNVKIVQPDHGCVHVWIPFWQKPLGWLPEFTEVLDASIRGFHHFPAEKLPLENNNPIVVKSQEYLIRPCVVIPKNWYE